MPVCIICEKINFAEQYFSTVYVTTKTGDAVVCAECAYKIYVVMRHRLQDHSE